MGTGPKKISADCVVKQKSILCDIPDLFTPALHALGRERHLVCQHLPLIGYDQSHNQVCDRALAYTRWTYNRRGLSSPDRQIKIGDHLGLASVVAKGDL